MSPSRILLLGGTAEASALAQALIDRFGSKIDLVTSLAGRTSNPAPIPGKLRVGGFGGISGLSHYLRDMEIALVVDATHPFAARISANAAKSCAELSIPRLRLERPAWRPTPEDHWIEVGNVAEAAATAKTLARRIWLTLGTADLTDFAGAPESWFLIRSIASPQTPVPLARYELLLGRGPFTLEAERSVIETYRIGALVTKASGGAATAAKLVAAREAKLPVVMIRRPPEPIGDRTDSLSAALDWVGGYVALE